MYKRQAPKTIWHGTCDRTLLDKYVEYVGGFPVVIKVAGGTRGIGVMFAEDHKTLFGICDFLAGSSLQFAIREYIPSESVERAVVIGDRVCCVVSRSIRSKDFRSVGHPETNLQLKTVPDELSRLAVSACHVAGFNFGGIDIVRNIADSTFKVLEVNCPHDFLLLENSFNQEIAGMLVDWLSAQIAG